MDEEELKDKVNAEDIRFGKEDDSSEQSVIIESKENK